MSASARPGVGTFVPGRERNKTTSGSLAFGYQYGNGWRLEGEYTLPVDDTFSNGSSRFPGNDDVHRIRSQRVMANAYRDFPISHRIALYGSGGLGVSRLASSGWQGVQTRRYNSARQDNLTWAVGAGASFAVSERLRLELGYRYVDMGQARSGWNAYTNGRGLRDEMMRATLVSSEFVVGGRYAF